MTCLAKRNRAAVVLGLLAALAVSPSFADTAASPKPVTSIEGITEYRLDNGLRVLLFPDESTPTVTVNLTVFVGSRHEGYGETGMAHLLEHLVFKGTPTHKDVPKALRDHGADFNGSTWVDRTNYYETMPGTDANLEFGIRLEADRLVNSFIRRDDLASEMTVVRNEFERGENDPENILSQRMMAVAYEWHNYGQSTIGNRSDIERVPIDQLQAFYRKYYRPDNCMLVIAGRFDPAKALAFTQKYFGVLKNPAQPLPATYTEEPPQDGERTVVLRRVGKIGVVGAIYHIPAGAHEDFAPLEVLNQVLVSQPSGRLYTALVTAKKASSVSGAAFGWHDPGVIEFAATVDPNSSLEVVRDTMTKVLEGLQTDKATAEEVERAKRRLLKERELLMARSNRIGIVLSEWGAKGDWRLFFLHRDRLAKVTPSDVTRVADRYLQRNNRTVGLYFPSAQAERAEIPSTPPVAELVKDYKGTQTIAQGEAFDPTPENIEKRVQRTDLPGSGLKVAFLPRKTRGESVVLEFILRYSNPEALKGKTSASQFLAPLMARGTKKHNRQQIEDELDRLKARLQPGGLLGLATFTVECKRETLPAVVALITEILREPTFPAEEFDVLKRQQLDALQQALAEPSALASRALQRKLNPYPPEDVRYVPTVEESIERLKKVTVEQVRQLYTEQLGSQAGELAVVGDFDPAATRKVLQEAFRDWKAPVSYERIARPASKIPGERLVIETPDKANAFYFAAHDLAMTDADPDFAALQVANFILGGGTLSSRLGNRIRQKEGLSYGVRSQFSADAIDKAGRFQIFAICNPQNIDKVDKAVAEELDKFLKDGVSETELAEAKKAFLEQLKVQRSRDGTLADLLIEELHAGRTFAYYADLEKKVASLTPQQVNEAVRKHLEPKKLIVVHAGDFKHKKSAAK